MFELHVDETLIGRKKIEEMTKLGTLPAEFLIGSSTNDSFPKSIVETDYTVEPDNKLLIKLKHRTVSQPINLLILNSLDTLLENNHIDKKYIKDVKLFYENGNLKIKLTVIDKQIILLADGIEEELTNIENIRKQLISSGNIQKFTEFLSGEFVPELHINGYYEVDFIMSKTLKISDTIINDADIIAHILAKDGRLSFKRCGDHQIACNLKVKNSGYSTKNFVKLEINLNPAQVEMLNLVTELNNYILRQGTVSYLDDAQLRAKKAGLDLIISKNKSDFENLILVMSNTFRNTCRMLNQKHILSYNIDDFLKSKASSNPVNPETQAVGLRPTNNPSIALPSQGGMYRRQKSQEDFKPASKDQAKGAESTNTCSS